MIPCLIAQFRARQKERDTVKTTPTTLAFAALALTLIACAPTTRLGPGFIGTYTHVPGRVVPTEAPLPSTDLAARMWRVALVRQSLAETLQAARAHLGICPPSQEVVLAGPRHGGICAPSGNDPQTLSGILNSAERAEGGILFWQGEIRAAQMGRASLEELDALVARLEEAAEEGRNALHDLATFTTSPSALDRHPPTAVARMRP